MDSIYCKDSVFAISGFSSCHLSHLCHLWIPSLSSLDVVVVIFGCNLFLLWMLSFLHHFLPFSFIGCYHWMLYLGATWKIVTLWLHFLQVSFSSAGFGEGQPEQRKKLEAITKGNALIDHDRFDCFQLWGPTLHIPLVLVSLELGVVGCAQSPP